MEGLFDYIEGNSLLHRLSPITKLAVAFILSAACFITKSMLFCLAAIAACALLSHTSGAGRRFTKSLASLLKLGAVLFVMQILFVSDGRTLISMPLGLKVTDKGLSFSLLMSLRLISATLPLMVMLSVTKLRDLSGALTDTLHVPYRYSFALAASLRFIPLLASEMSAIMEAQRARGVEFDAAGPLKKLRLILPLCVPMLITSVRKTESTAISAELRGFAFRKPRGKICMFRLCPRDFTAIAASIAFLAAASAI